MCTEYCTEYLSVLRYCSGRFIYSWWCSLFTAICCAVYCFCPFPDTLVLQLFSKHYKSLSPKHTTTATTITTTKRTRAKKMEFKWETCNLWWFTRLPWLLRLFFAAAAAFPNFRTFIHTNPIPTWWLIFLRIKDCSYVFAYQWHTVSCKYLNDSMINVLKIERKTKSVFWKFQCYLKIKSIHLEIHEKQQVTCKSRKKFGIYDVWWFQFVDLIVYDFRLFS